MAQPPSNFLFNHSSSTLSWDPSPDGNIYQIEYSDEEEGLWTVIYTGIATNCPFPLPPGTYKIRGRSKTSGEEYGPYSQPKIIKVTV